MNLIEIIGKIIPVLLAGLVFGAGLPSLYALALRLLAGETEYTADGRLIETEPASGVAKAFAYIIFTAIALVVVAGIFWIAKDFVYHYTGLDLFGVAAD